MELWLAASAVTRCPAAHRLSQLVEHAPLLFFHPPAAFRGMVEETARHTRSSGSGGVQRTKSAKAVLQAVRGRLQ